MKKLNSEEVSELAKKEWESEKMQKHIINKYDYYEINNKYIIELSKPSKITIDKTMYYDDETEPPAKTLENFINYNLKMQFNQSYKYKYFYEQNKNVKFGLSRNNNTTHFLNFWRWENEPKFDYILNDEEVQELLKIEEDAKNKYIERLTKYFKRYNDKIGRVGYWANR